VSLESSLGQPPAPLGDGSNTEQQRYLNNLITERFRPPVVAMNELMATIIVSLAPAVAARFAPEASVPHEDLFWLVNGLFIPMFSLRAWESVRAFQPLATKIRPTVRRHQQKRAVCKTSQYCLKILDIPCRLFEHPCGDDKWLLSRFHTPLPLAMKPGTPVFTTSLSLCLA
jgi:hypothetical protein